MDEVVITPDPSIAPKVPITKPSSSVLAVQPLINLDEEPVATDVKEEPETTANPSTICASRLVVLAIVVFYFLVWP